MRKSYFLLLLPLLMSNMLFGQMNPVKWQFSSDKNEDGSYTVLFVADVDDGWSIYSQHTDPSGPIPTAFIFNSDENIELIGDVEESGKKKEGYDKLFEVNVIKFSGEVKFSQKLIAKNGVDQVKGYLEFMCCDEEKCLPPKEVEFEIDL